MENKRCVYCQRAVEEADGDYLVMAGFVGPGFVGLPRRAHQGCQEYAELLAAEALNRVRCDCTCDPCLLAEKFKVFVGA